MELSDCFSAPKHVMARVVGDETVILDLQSGVYFGLDPVGTDIWKLLVEGVSLADIRTSLLDRYDVTATQLESDVLKLASELQSRGLILPAP